MSTTYAPSPPVRRTSPPAAGLAVVLALLAAELVLAHELVHLEVWASPHLDRSLDALWRLVFTLPRWALLAVWLVLWGRTPRRRLAGAAVALLGGVLEWGIQEGFYRLATHSADVGLATYRGVDWTLTLLLPTIAALAWGVARRQGRAWPVGLVLAPVLAAVVHQGYRSDPFASWLFDSPWWVRTLVLLAPAVLAGVGCWLIERREQSR